MALNLRQLRADLGTVAQTSGFNAWDYEPDDVQDLPAAVVSGIKEMNRLNERVTQLKVGVTFLVSLADPADAAARLDTALSVGVQDSFIDALDSVSVENDGPAWRSVRFDSCGPYTRYTMPSGGSYLGVEVVLELTA